MPIEPVVHQERQALLDLAVATQLFTAEEADGLLGGVLDELAAGSLPPGHTAICCRPAPQAAVTGWAYFAPDAHALGVWNLWWIGVHPDAHGSGAGQGLLQAVETAVTAQQGRVLVIETSDAELLARARRFYAARGYAECGRVPDFYGEGEAKVIFAKRLARNGSASDQ